MARCDVLRFSWQAQYLVTPGVGVGESVLAAVSAVSGRCGPLRGVLLLLYKYLFKSRTT